LTQFFFELTFAGSIRGDRFQMSAMKFWALCAVALVNSIAATAFADKAPLQIDFSWAQTERCTSKSPEIHVSNVPKGTVKFEVVLQDLDVPTYHHGGGTVRANADGDIPAGALNDYRGPCPPSGAHTYRFTVNALDASGIEIGTGSKSAPFPSN
jgi:phosphatidylethanolamine-binding protein (PEBP) family uncharacterized protein